MEGDAINNSYRAKLWKRQYKERQTNVTCLLCEDKGSLYQY